MTLAQRVARYVPASLRPFARSLWHAMGLLRPTTNRSFLHGWLFSLGDGKYRTEDMEFQFPASQFPTSYRARFYFDSYEAPERDLARKYVGPDAAVLELGGCIGVVSCVVNSLLTERSRHVVLEPNPEAFAALMSNRDRNQAKFRAIQGVLSASGPVAISIGHVATASRAGANTGKTVLAPNLTLSELQDSIGFKFDTLIADIEGGEKAFFSEFSEILDQLKLLIVELHPTIVGEAAVLDIRQRFEERGFRMVEQRLQTEVWVRQTT